jgi:hypothetical protein
MGEKKHAYRFLVGKLEGMISLGRFDVNGRIILKSTLEKYYAWN